MQIKMGEFWESSEQNDNTWCYQGFKKFSNFFWLNGDYDCALEYVKIFFERFQANFYLIDDNIEFTGVSTSKWVGQSHFPQVLSDFNLLLFMRKKKTHISYGAKYEDTGVGVCVRVCVWRVYVNNILANSSVILLHYLMQIILGKDQHIRKN